MRSRVTDREVLASWQADTAPDTEGPAIATSSGTPPASLAPGESTTLVVEATADELLDVAQAADSGATSSFTVSNAVPGVSITGTTAAIEALAAEPGVAKVSRIAERTLEVYRSVV